MHVMVSNSYISIMKWFAELALRSTPSIGFYFSPNALQSQVCPTFHLSLFSGSLLCFWGNCIYSIGQYSVCSRSIRAFKKVILDRKAIQKLLIDAPFSGNTSFSHSSSNTSRSFGSRNNEKCRLEDIGYYGFYFSDSRRGSQKGFLNYM